MLPFIALHIAVFAVFWVGVSAVAVLVALLSYGVRMFAVTAFYHRYFAHKAFRAGRVAQFCFAVIGASATQRGPLWWASHHRAHHRGADTAADPHESGRGFWWSHVGWFMASTHFRTRTDLVPDWSKFPELVWLDRFDLVVPVLFGAALFGLGEMLQALGTSGWQMVVWGYVVSTVVLIHVTALVNSICHRFGSRRFATRDDSRNNAVLALLTLGEGWHNNHHRYAGSARQGFYWWQVDGSYLLLRLMAGLGWVRDLKEVPVDVLSEGRRR